MSDATPRTILLADYQPPPFAVEGLELTFDVREEETLVTSLASYRRLREGPLRLDGVVSQLVSVARDGTKLNEGGDFTLDDDRLTLEGGDAFELEIVTRLEPQANTALEGLYLSRGTLCTQCEAEGFRRITFFPDRPDVMTTYRTRIEASRERYPVLLANGNLVDSGDAGDGRHFALWEDPFKKPCYLFALVAGDLGMVEDSFTTMSGREVTLRIFCRPGLEDRCGHAMRSLQRSMKWDEETYGREYDLDLFMIVAVDDFNFGAMENKGLNVFNSALILARPDTATDADYQNIESVVGHEYFHNWSGNRVTLRDWFQLSLKEGFTVFREHGFAAAMNSDAVQRIQEVRYLRTYQFPEDAGPMAHPVRPASFIKIDNFYTMTVYEKGAEVIRMLWTLLGEDDFRKGSDLYFERHDGAAVTTEEFVAAMEEASGRDLGQFRRWYEQAGTPVVTATGVWDEAAGTYALTLSQRCPATPGQETKEPFHLPVKVGLIGPDGADLPLRLEDGEETTSERVLELLEPESTWTFRDLPAPPVPSLLRGFSAPVKLETELPETELTFRLAHDSDGFNRWEAGQALALRTLLAASAGQAAPSAEGLLAAIGRVLEDDSLDPALAAETLILPSESYLGDQQETVAVEANHAARNELRRAVGERFADVLRSRYEGLATDGADVDAAAMGRRRLRNVCLAYLASTGSADAVALARAQLEAATSMTEEIAALACLVDLEVPERDQGIAHFHDRWKDESLVMNKWLAVQAGADRPGVLDAVRSLTSHPVYDIKNPNKVRAVLGAFSRNAIHFHRLDGEGYAFIADQVIDLDGRNPQLAARLVDALSRWRRYDAERQGLMRRELGRIAETEGLSPNVHEIVAKSLE